MKKYVTPEMKALTFEVEENIGAPTTPSDGDPNKLFNDAGLAW